MKRKVSLYKNILSILFLMVVSINSIYSQDDSKLKIAIVSQLDTTLTIIDNEEFVKSFNINLKEKWLDLFSSNLDSTKFQIQLLEMPNEVKNNYFGVMYRYTDGIIGVKASRKLSKWFETINYDFVILLGRPVLMYQYGFSYLNKYSYGLILDKNYSFSLNEIYVYNVKNKKVIFHNILNSYDDYLEKVMINFDKEQINYITVENLNSTIKGILILNNKLGLKTCKKIKKILF